MEIWKPIPEFEGYEASSLGNVRSVDREFKMSTKIIKGEFFKKRKGQKLKVGLSKVGYFHTSFGRGKTYRIHRAVWSAFNGYWPDPIMKINHINGIKTDNRIENLELVTHKENVVHGIRTGLRKRVKNNRVDTIMLSEQDIKTIRLFFHDKDRSPINFIIAKVFGVTQRTIRDIGRKRSHKWLLT